MSYDKFKNNPRLNPIWDILSSIGSMWDDYNHINPRANGSRSSYLCLDTIGQLNICFISESGLTTKISMTSDFEVQPNLSMQVTSRIAIGELPADLILYLQQQVSTPRIKVNEESIATVESNVKLDSGVFNARTCNRPIGEYAHRVVRGLNEVVNAAQREEEGPLMACGG